MRVGTVLRWVLSSLAIALAGCPDRPFAKSDFCENGCLFDTGVPGSVDSGRVDAAVGIDGGPRPDAQEEDSGVDPRCGNGAIDGLEACDDGNLITGDGCGLCRIESNYRCPTPNVPCVRWYGDALARVEVTVTASRSALPPSFVTSVTLDLAATRDLLGLAINPEVTLVHHLEDGSTVAAAPYFDPQSTPENMRAWFRMRDPLPLGSAQGGYYFYFAEAAGPAANPAEIFSFFDDFETPAPLPVWGVSGNASLTTVEGPWGQVLAANATVAESGSAFYRNVMPPMDGLISTSFVQIVEGVDVAFAEEAVINAYCGNQCGANGQIAATSLHDDNRLRLIALEGSESTLSAGRLTEGQWHRLDLRISPVVAGLSKTSLRIDDAPAVELDVPHNSGSVELMGIGIAWINGGSVSAYFDSVWERPYSEYEPVVQANPSIELDPGNGP